MSDTVGVPKIITKFLFVFAICIVVVVALLTVLFFLSQETGRLSDEENEMKIMKILKIKPENSERYTGTVKMRNSEEAEVFFIDEFGYYTLISDFGTEEYVCEGRCSHSSENGRRNSGVIRGSSKAIYFLVAAMSSALAYKEASEYFKRQCMEYKGIDSVDFYDEIEDEEEMFDSDYYDEDEDDERFQHLFEGKCIPDKERNLKMTESPYIAKMKFWCVGRCINYDFRDTDEDILDCKVNEMSAPVEVTGEVEPEDYFIEKEMTPFCDYKTFQLIKHEKIDMTQTVVYCVPDEENVKCVP